MRGELLSGTRQRAATRSQRLGLPTIVFPSFALSSSLTIETAEQSGLGRPAALPLRFLGSLADGESWVQVRRASPVTWSTMLRRETAAPHSCTSRRTGRFTLHMKRTG